METPPQDARRALVLLGRLRDRITPRGLLWVNRVSGTALLVFGVLAILHALGLDESLLVALGVA